MKHILSNIQNGYLIREGYRGRWITIYKHLYNGNPERTERYHSHPWKLAISFVIKGGFIDDIERRWKKRRRRFSIAFYGPNLRHRLIYIKPGTKSIFIGFFRTQIPIKSADVACEEGYCHYSEMSGNITER